MLRFDLSSVDTVTKHTFKENTAQALLRGMLYFYKGTALLVHIFHLDVATQCDLTIPPRSHPSPHSCPYHPTGVTVGVRTFSYLNEGREQPISTLIIGLPATLTCRSLCFVYIWKNNIASMQDWVNLDRKWVLCVLFILPSPSEPLMVWDRPTHWQTYLNKKQDALWPCCL